MPAKRLLKKKFRKAMNVLGLQDWEVEFYFGPVQGKDAHACCWPSLRYKTVTVGFDQRHDNWKNENESVAKTALHEAAHVMLSPLTELFLQVLKTYVKDKQANKTLKELLVMTEENMVSHIERIPALLTSVELED